MSKCDCKDCKEWHNRIALQNLNRRATVKSYELARKATKSLDAKINRLRKEYRRAEAAQDALYSKVQQKEYKRLMKQK